MQKIFRGHHNTVNNVSFSPDGKRIASASDDKTVKIWNLEGKEIKSIVHPSPVWSVIFSPDGKLIATASNDKTIRLWNIDGTLKGSFIAHEDQINDLSFSPDSQILASASNDKTVKLWDINHRGLIDQLESSQIRFNSVSFSPDGQWIAAAKDGESIVIWKKEGFKWEPLQNSVILGKHWKNIYEVNFSPNSKLLASASEDGTIKLWNTDVSLITTLKSNSKPMLSVNFSPDGKTVVGIQQSDSSRISLWNIDTNQVDKNTNFLLKKACVQLSDYLENNPNISDGNKEICDELDTSQSNNK